MRPENLASSHAVKRAARSPQLLALPGTTSRPARPAVWYKCARRCQSSAAMLLICARMRCGCSSRSQHTYTSHAGTHALARTRARSDTHKTLLRSLTEALPLSFTCSRSLAVLMYVTERASATLTLCRSARFCGSPCLRVCVRAVVSVASRV
jgi:hypothetical protein